MIRPTLLLAVFGLEALERGELAVAAVQQGAGPLLDLGGGLLRLGLAGGAAGLGFPGVLGLRAASAWPDAPRPVAADALGRLFTILDGEVRTVVLRAAP